MRVLFISAFFFGQAVCASALRAQCVGLAELLAIGAEPTALTAPKVVTDRLPFEWTYVAPTDLVRETAWTFMPSGTTTPTSRLQVRAQRPGQDVVLKTTQANCMRDLRGELKSLKLTAQPVTCPGCEAVRYQGAGFEATIYSQMKGEYPFVVVVHQVPAAAPAVAESTAPLLPVELATAVRLLADSQATVLDVRTPEEYGTGHLARAQNVDFRASDFSAQVARLDPKARYVLYCASGNRSGRAAVIMQKLGFTNIVNAGGYGDLKAAGAK